MKSHLIRIAVSAVGLNLAVFGSQFVATILPFIPAAIFAAIACGSASFFLFLSLSRLI
jgi:hypothetical protein